MSAAGRRRGRFVWLVSWALILGRADAPAQPPVTNLPPLDPLMSLLLSQPKLDLSGPVTPTAGFDPPTIRPGERAFYRLTFNALEQSVQLPETIATQPPLPLEPRAHGQVLQTFAHKQTPISAFNFRCQPQRAGEINVPEFVVQVDGKPVTVPAAQLKVIEGGEETVPPPQLFLELHEGNVFVGQPVRARVRFPGTATGGVQGFAQGVQFIGEGFLTDASSVHQSIQVLPYGQAAVATYLYETTLIPIAPGEITVFAQGFASGNRFSGPIVISGSVTFSGGIPQYTLVESDSVRMHAKPLPEAGKLPGFTGAFGNLGLDVPQLSTNQVRVGEALRMTVIVRARAGQPANLTRLVPPSPPKSELWQVLEAEPSGLPPQILQAQGFTTFQYTMIPLSETATETPTIPFSYFDLERKTYADLTIPPVPVTVTPGTLAADLKALLQPDLPSESDDEEQMVLSALAGSPGKQVGHLVPGQLRTWFPVVQLSPAFAFIALVGWDRRRRYLQQHPDIVLRRRARRALRRKRREIRRAARAGDGTRFAHAVVSALQIACSPHFPAEPRALVASDVMSLLEAGPAKDIVRRFFATHDASHFAGDPADANALLLLEAQVESLLDQLEARL